jgi:tRNA modification GTPase
MGSHCLAAANRSLCVWNMEAEVASASISCCQMRPILNDTIAAIATPPGEGGVGIVRISGPLALSIADTLFHSTSSKQPSLLPSHTIHYGILRDPATDEPVDDALLLIFRAPRSYTGEEVVEFSCHGGSVTTRRVLTLVLRAGARLAEPGEFTLRAFLNGKMDLAQAEAVSDQIRAKTETAQQIALRQRAGCLSKRVGKIKDRLVGLLAAAEATIDFSEEIGELNYTMMAEGLRHVREEIESLIRSASYGRIYREGIRLVIVGRPNVGKSSLLNALLRQDRAIVTPIAGTTRDLIEESANIRGIPLVAIDTAGIRDTEDLVERIGVERAREAIESASLILYVLDASDNATHEDKSMAALLAERPSIRVYNKIDLLDSPQRERLLAALSDSGAVCVAVSAANGWGMEILEETIEKTLLGGGYSEGESMLISITRHQRALEQARDSLREAEATTCQKMPADFITIDIRAALDALGLITGETATEEIIHRIFQDFCIGK